MDVCVDIRVVPGAVWRSVCGLVTIESNFPMYIFLIDVMGGECIAMCTVQHAMWVSSLHIIVLPR